MSSKRPIFVYHGNCHDGFGAAWVAHKVLGDNCTYTFGERNTPPKNVEGRDVYIADFTFSEQQLRDLASKANRVINLDHHKTGGDVINKLIAEGVIEGEYNVHMSGASLAWKWFFKDEPAPDLVRYIEDRDLWLKQLPSCDDYFFSLLAYPMDFDVWTGLSLRSSIDMINEGKLLVKNQQNQIEKILSRGVSTLYIEGFEVPVCNAPFMFASDIGHQLSQGNDFAATYTFHNDEIKFSLRSNDEGQDVAVIAAKFGGGGHRNAAGFIVSFDQLTFSKDRVILSD